MSLFVLTLASIRWITYQSPNPAFSKIVITDIINVSELQNLSQLKSSTAQVNKTTTTLETETTERSGTCTILVYRFVLPKRFFMILAFKATTAGNYYETSSMQSSETVMFMMETIVQDCHRNHSHCNRNR